MVQPGRSSGLGEQRYGFNGMEKDDEVKGEGNSYTTEYRQYDPRIARWTSRDPKFKNFPWQSPYVAFDNNPIVNVDPKGAAAESAGGGGDKITKLTNRKRKLEDRQKSNNYGPIRNAVLNTRINILDKRIERKTSLYPNENGSGSMIPRAKGDLDGEHGGGSGEYGTPDGTIKEEVVDASPELKQFGYRVPIVKDGSVEILEIGSPETIEDANGNRAIIPVWKENNVGQEKGSPVKIEGNNIVDPDGNVLFSLPKGVSANDGFFKPGEVVSTVNKDGSRTHLGLATETTVQRTFVKNLYDASGKFVGPKGIRPANITEEVIELNP